MDTILKLIIISIIFVVTTCYAGVCLLLSFLNIATKAAITHQFQKKTKVKKLKGFHNFDAKAIKLAHK
mgnify:CR=1 FL=1|tara:strand:+ start:59771 stop:59974 length:204 start_codon:yes stop_codon:yes gene_type:complete